MGRKARIGLSAKQKKAAYLYAIELKTQKEISDILKISEQSICAWKKKPEWNEEIDRLLKEEWKESCKKLQKKMIDKADRGDFRALEYVLNSNGYKAPEELVVENKTINVTIEDD